VTEPRAASGPHRRLAPSSARRVSGVILVVGSVLAVAAAFGSLWVVRGGVVLAVLAAVFATTVTWRELTRERRRHAAETLAASRAHGQALRDERSHNQQVLQVVTDRNSRAVAEIERQHVVIAGMRTEISTLRGDKAALTATLAQRDRTIGSLRDTVRTQEAELLALTADDEEAEGTDSASVHAMPRRVLLEERPASGPDAAELWDDGSHPTVVDMAAIDVPVLPNYEEDRRLA
jgi:hypothetical protein